MASGYGPPRPFRGGEQLDMFVNCQGSGTTFYSNAVYYPNYSVYRGLGPSSMNIDCVSHIFYAFAWPNEDGTISLSDEYADTRIEVEDSFGCISALMMLRLESPRLKIILSIGGGGRGSEHFATIATNEYLRRVFAYNAGEVVRQYNFDGVDIDWEHPSNATQGTAFVALLSDLRSYLSSPCFIVTATLPAGAWVLRHIPLEAAALYLDHLNLMAYDFAGPWSPTSGHHAQLFPSHNISSSTTAVALPVDSGSAGVAFARANGVPAAKILLGIPLFGRSFLGTTGPGQPCTEHGGEEGSFPVRALPRPGSVEGRDLQTATAWCVGDDGGWVSYDDAATVRCKADFVRAEGLGGLFYWEGTGDRTGDLSLIKAGWKALRGE